MTVTEITPKADTKATDYMAAFRKASASKSITDDMLKAGAVLFGDPTSTAAALVKGEALVAEGRSLIADNEPNVRKWLAIATLASDGGVSARRWAAAFGGNPNTLGRLTRAASILDAARKNHVSMTVGEAVREANRLNAGEVTALVTAFAEAEDGTDPRKGDDVKSVGTPAAPTVESYLKALDAVADRLSTLLAGDFKAPKAETLEAMTAHAATLERIAKQHATLTAMVRKAGQSPAKADRVAKSA